MTYTLRRLSRRTVLTDFGAAGVGLVILGACGGSSDSSSSVSSSAASTNRQQPEAGDDTEPTVDEQSGQQSTPAAGTEPPSDADATDDTALQLQHVSRGFVSAYVLMRGGEAAIVDTGTSGSRDAILEGLEAFSLAPSDVRHIVLTHNHGDHIGGLSELEGEMSGATAYNGAGDIESIQTSLTLTQVGDGDEVFEMGVVATPGHTPGSISVFDTASGILVAGDAINGDGDGGLTGANPDFTPDLESATRSVEKLAALMPTTAAFGHGGPPVTDDVAGKLAALTE